jgi:hypothetical protein
MRFGCPPERLRHGVVLPQAAIGQAEVVQRWGVAGLGDGDSFLVSLRRHQCVAQVNPQQRMIGAFGLRSPQLG